MDALCPGCEMRELLRRFWEINYIPLYAAYGQAWFVLGIIALLNSRRRSRLPLARSILFLGLFGVTHALREWGFVFIPIQAAYLPAKVVDLMEWGHLVLLPVSFLFLLAFTVHLVVALGLGPRQLWVLPGAIMVGWVACLILMYGVWRWGTAPVFRLADIVARYGMALPSGLTSAWVLWYQADMLPSWASRENGRWLRFLSLTFLAFAFFDGLVTPRADFFPARVFNYTALLDATGFPIPVYRILVALSMSLGTWATVRLFEEDVRQRIYALEQERVLLADRERISRELHDHTIQALYALGLEIERAQGLLNSNTSQAREILAQALARLNDVITETRAFVYNLRGDSPASFAELVAQAIAAVRARDFLEVHVEIDDSLASWPCVPEHARHIMAILEEALSNVIKHAGAHTVRIFVRDEGDSAIVCVCDDGRGFDVRHTRRGMGLRHMRERAYMLGGVLNVQSAEGKGTKVRLIVPRPVEGIHVEGRTTTPAGAAGGRS